MTEPTVTQVIEVVEVIDYTELLTAHLTDITILLGYLTSFLLFFVVVLLAYFCYKFFRIFF